MISITNEPIDFAAVTDSVRHNNSGAVVLFMGTVREMTGDKQTTRLEYEAYPEMAEAKMNEIAAAAREKWADLSISAVHRVGQLDLGEIAVAIAVSAPHRTEAFEAGRFMIDTIKDEVPIWKKENWADGTKDWVHPGIEPGATT